MIATWLGKAVGANRRLLWSPRAHRMVPNPAYKKFKESMAAEFMNHAERFEGAVHVYVRMILNARMDSDSILKPLFDALELAEIVKNDNQIKSYAVNRENKKRGEPDRVVVIVEEEKENARSSTQT